MPQCGNGGQVDESHVGNVYQVNLAFFWFDFPFQLFCSILGLAVMSLYCTNSPSAQAAKLTSTRSIFSSSTRPSASSSSFCMPSIYTPCKTPHWHIVLATTVLRTYDHGSTEHRVTFCLILASAMFCYFNLTTRQCFYWKKKPINSFLTAFFTNLELGMGLSADFLCAVTSHRDTVSIKPNNRKKMS